MQFILYSLAGIGAISLLLVAWVIVCTACDNWQTRRRWQKEQLQRARADVLYDRHRRQFARRLRLVADWFDDDPPTRWLLAALADLFQESGLPPSKTELRKTWEGTRQAERERVAVEKANRLARRIFDIKTTPDACQSPSAPQS